MNIDRLNFLKANIHLLDIDIKNGFIKNRSAWAATSGRLYVKLQGEHYAVHEIIAVAGGHDILDLTVDHINEICTDNRFANLEPVTRPENSKRWTGRIKHWDMIDILKADHAEGLNQAQLARKYNIPKQSVWRLLRM